jgi:hypothetical protein
MYWNWGNPFSGWMWNMWYYSDIDKERRQWILDHSTDASSLADNLRRAQTPGPGEIATMRGLAEACVQFTAMAAGMASASNPLQGLPRVGSALKTDAYHAFPNIVDNFAGAATATQLRAGVTLYQLEGSLNGVAGRFEWIVDAGRVTHRMFVPGGRINGIPIRP